MKKFGYCIIPLKKSKYNIELNFWENELINYQKWYNNLIPSHYGEPPPTENQKIIVQSQIHSAILTWTKNHQYKKYLADLMLDESAFNGLNILDLGSGPIPSSAVFKNCNIFCLDPLLPDYMKIGFPLHYYKNVTFIHAFSEDIPVIDKFFDAIISVNAIDHVDDLYKTVKEIQRVLKPSGLIRLHVHYHKKTETEPIELDDRIIENAFHWCNNWHKIKESKIKHGFELENNEEKYVLWSNFD